MFEPKVECKRRSEKIATATVNPAKVKSRLAKPNSFCQLAEAQSAGIQMVYDMQV